MGLNWKRSNLNDLGAYYGRIPNQLLDALEEDMGDIAKEGADLMRQYIRTRGTEKSGKDGRIETEAMLKAVRSRTDRDSRNKIRVRWGWLATRRKYFRYQEQGFVHWRSGQDVEPMHALLDSYIQKRDEIISRIEKRTK